MLKETGYQEKIEWVKPWLPQIIEQIKRELKQEHLRIDREFCRRYFLGKGANSVTVAQMADAYAIDIAAGNIGLGEFIATRWLVKNTDIYNFFEEKLKSVTPDFEQLEELELSLSQALKDGAIAAFGAVRTYLFVVLNSVVFPEEVLSSLRKLAEEETTSKHRKEEKERIEKSIESMQKRHDRELRTLLEKHESRLAGLQKMYFKDTEMLKEQIRRFQKKLDG